jgi:hypothetical protein
MYCFLQDVLEIVGRIGRQHKKGEKDFTEYSVKKSEL